jgi:hypothetical protein
VPMLKRKTPREVGLRLVAALGVALLVSAGDRNACLTAKGSRDEETRFAVRDLLAARALGSACNDALTSG